MTLHVGFARRDVTPPLHSPMGGYGARAGVAEGILDPLLCRVAVLSSPDARAAVIVLDWVYVSKAWSDAVRVAVSRTLGCPAANILVAATHTHSGPAVFRSGPLAADDMHDYEAEAASRVLEAVEEARLRLEPVALSHGRAEVGGVAANRREVSGEVDTGVDTLVARDSSGGCIGLIASFGCHPTVLPASNLLYSADLFGAAVAVAERQLGATVILCNGAAGDVSTRFTRAEQTPAEVGRLGAILGEGVIRAAGVATPIASNPLRAWSGRVPVRLRSLPSLDVARQLVVRSAREVDEVRANRGARREEERLAASRLEGALGQLFLATRGGAEGMLGRVPADAELQLIEVGDGQIVGVPGEMFSSAAAQIRGVRRRALLIVGYANDYLGYLVPRAASAAGGYENLMAVIEPSSADAMAQRLATMARL